MRTREEIVKAIEECGIVAVIRASSSEEALAAVDAILAGGVRAIEITFTVPGAAQVIADLHKRFGEDIVLGAGTVLTKEQALAAIEAGAEFIVAPNTNPIVIDTAAQKNCVVAPGAFSPTEVVTALQSGADLVKIFPANVLGPGYLKDLKGPFPKIKTIPTGGIGLENAADYFKAGAAAIGVGGKLVDLKALRSGQPEKLTETARQFIAIVQQARAAQ